MNKIAVAVCDTDREYRDRFVTYLVERKAEEYAVSAFSMPEKLLEALEEEKPDLAICGTGFEEMAERLAGYDIPVITVKYSLWDRIHEREGSPDFIASKLKEEAQEESFSVVCVHAWSRFEGDTYGASAAKRCAERLDDRFEAVNMQELEF